MAFNPLFIERSGGGCGGFVKGKLSILFSLRALETVRTLKARRILSILFSLSEAFKDGRVEAGMKLSILFSLSSQTHKKI